MPRRGENIYKRKDGRWEGRYLKSRNGDQVKYGYIYSKSYTDVKKQLIEKKAQYSFLNQNLKASIVKEVFFSDVSEIWLYQIKSSVKESTLIKYRNILSCHVIPEIGAMKLSEIDYSTISVMCNNLLISGGRNKTGLSSKSVSDILSVTKEIIKYAERLKYKIDRTALDFSITIKTKPLRLLSIHEQHILMTYLGNNPDSINLGIIICLFTGIRVGELCALTWEDISFKHNIISIQRTMQRIQILDGESKTAIIITEPKSQCSIREIPISKDLREIFVKEPVKEGYILTGDKYKYMEPRLVQKKFKKIMDKCEFQNVHFHTLRHTFATRCIEVGFDVKSLSEILGHANVNITMNRYVHPSMELKKKNMDKLTNLFAVNYPVCTHEK